QSFQHVEEIGGKTRLGVALLLQRQDRHGQLSQVLQRQVIEMALLGEPHRGIEVVAPETAAVADANALHASNLPGPDGSLKAGYRLVGDLDSPLVDPRPWFRRPKMQTNWPPCGHYSMIRFLGRG